MLVYCHRNYAECVIAPLRYWKKGVFREMGSFACWNFTVSASSMLSEYGVGIVLNHFFGVALNAVSRNHTRHIAIIIGEVFRIKRSDRLKLKSRRAQ